MMSGFSLMRRRMLSILRRWLALDHPGSNRLPCVTPFLMEAQRAPLARAHIPWLPEPPTE